MRNPLHSTIQRASIIGVLILLMACTTPQKPDLKRLYATDRQGQQPPLVLIHGTFGARLRSLNTGKDYWPGTLLDILFSDYRKLALDIDPASLTPRPSDLEAYALTEQVAGRDFYKAILTTLQDAGRYIPGAVGEPATDSASRYYVFVYDWRQDAVVNVRRLDAFIEQIRADHGDPSLKVDLIAHSMGGLLARYYIRYGTEDVLDDNDFPLNFRGAAHVRRAILLGTPNLGSVVALQNILQGFQVGLGRIPPEVLATMPGAYQLLPHPLNDWLTSANGEPLNRDLFDVDVWRQFQWSIFDPSIRQRIRGQFDAPEQADAHLALMARYIHKHLERGRRFVWSLTVREADSPVKLIVFGGDCTLTPARLVVEEDRGDSVLRLWPNEIKHPEPGVNYDRLMLEPGDGSVTKASLLARTQLDPRVPRHRHVYFPLDYTVLSCEKHDRLTANIHFQDNLLHVLLSPSP